jgi:hypothetical protein
LISSQKVPNCHPEPFASCHPERSEGSRFSAQDKLREGSGFSAQGKLREDLKTI